MAGASCGYCGTLGAVILVGANRGVSCQLARFLRSSLQIRGCDGEYGSDGRTCGSGGLSRFSSSMCLMRLGGPTTAGPLVLY
jgi:hypothetical protein